MVDPTRIDVLGIGNAIVDVLSRVDDDFLVREGLAKGSMRLVNANEADRLYQKVGSATESSGGSAGNTVAGIASLGGSAAFIGKVAEDQLGAIFRHDMRAVGILFDTVALDHGDPTARSIVLVTPDGERTMNTYLGAAQALGPDDIDRDLVSAARITFLEGYLWDPPDAKAAFRRAAEFAHEANRKVALTLSDSFCVDRYRTEFLDLIRNDVVNIVLANASELKSLYETADIETGLQALSKDCSLAAVTASEDGAYVISAGEITHVPADPVPELVDATGAGDLFASGFLYGIAREWTPSAAAALGAFAAAEVITHIGARPAVSLEDAASRGGFVL
ncbi:MAG: adenosine kinase [Alphaproteobacteria bacterium]